MIIGMIVGAYFLFFTASNEESTFLRINVNEGEIYNMHVNMTTSSDMNDDYMSSEIVMSYEVVEKREDEIDFNISFSSIKMNGFSAEMGGDYSYNSKDVADDEFSQMMHLGYLDLLNKDLKTITVTERGEIIDEFFNVSSEIVGSLQNSDSFIVFPENEIEIGDSFTHTDITTGNKFTYIFDEVTSDEYMFKMNATVDGVEMSGTAGFFKSSCINSSSITEISQDGINLKMELKTEVVKK